MVACKPFTCFLFTAMIVPALAAQTHCPGNTAEAPFHSANHLVVLSVFINHTGPYDFLLDSGTQRTMIDTSLAAKLHLEVQGVAVVAGAASGQPAAYAQLGLVHVGSYDVAKQDVLVYDLQAFATHLHLQGILGEDFLERFDLLIDYTHHLFCLDDSGAMRAAVKGPHIPLVAVTSAENIGGPAAFLLVLARLSDGLRPVRLLIDTGASESMLFNTTDYMVLRPAHIPTLTLRGVDRVEVALSVLPPQEMRIGPLRLSGVSFLNLPRTGKESCVRGFDGVLSSQPFQRIFIDHADRYVVLDPGSGYERGYGLYRSR